MGAAVTWKALPTTACAALLVASGCRSTGDGQGGPAPAPSPSVASAAAVTSAARPRPSAAPADASGPDAAASPPVPLADAAPIGVDAVAPVGGNWLRCYSRFLPRTRPEVDVQRLALMCGPSNGMKRLSDVQVSSVADGGQPREHKWSARSGDCFRIFAVGEPSIDDLDIEVLAPSGRRIAFDTTDDRWPIVKPDGPFCVFDDGSYRARVRAQRGSGDYAVQIWRLR